MARIEVPITVLNGTTGLPVSGASIVMTRRGTGTAVPWWAAETGGSSSTAAVVTDSSGRANAWVDRGAYNLAVSGSGITSYTEAWDAVPGSDGSIDAAHVASTVLVPTGAVLPFIHGTAPTGFLLCDGAAVSRTTYLALYTLISTTYGIGDGSTTFNLPDMRGRVPVGVDGTAARLTANDALGQSGGAEKHVLLPTEIPRGTGVAGADVSQKNAVSDTPAAHNNMQPYLVFHYIIKT